MENRKSLSVCTIHNMFENKYVYEADKSMESRSGSINFNFKSVI